MIESSITVAAMTSCCFLATTLSCNLGSMASTDVEQNYLPYYYGVPASVSISSSLFITGDIVADYYQPRTALGKKLIALRREYILNGGQLLTGPELANELRLRRGGIQDA
ncbi:protein of unknown function [Acidithiobacillus ferrivorans]|uniref:Uncharacterized protein n=1 Tax=Acidithiobacillus ferrivorans TaxID=160808 RepID=A0A060UP13_9PROT|nr:hypothetical protein [Acidithiobacillus ferrivorans]CDQ09981.1 exported hypothetical protein [Acidithiobacillus ferrivorans]SMH65691.1 protein of unknown function [Acidithiobacillus ferrivorans]